MNPEDFIEHIKEMKKISGSDLRMSKIINSTDIRSRQENFREKEVKIWRETINNHLYDALSLCINVKVIDLLKKKGIL